MIKIDDTKMELKGSESELMAQLQLIIRAMYRMFTDKFDENMAEFLIMRVVDDAFKAERPVPLATVNFTDEFINKFLKKVMGE